MGDGARRLGRLRSRAPAPGPAVEITAELRRLHEGAAHALSRLDGVSQQMEPERLPYVNVRKEAVLSSQIEDTQSSPAELLEYENAAAPGTPVADVAAGEFRRTQNWVGGTRPANARFVPPPPIRLLATAGDPESGH